MADPTPASSPGTFVNELRESVRQEVEQEWHERLLSARAQIRHLNDKADAARICADQDQAARMAEYRRGRWYHIPAIITSAAAGLALGVIAQRREDLRIGGVPVLSLMGLPGIAGGAILDEGMALRACLSVGGAMFTVGTITHALCNPENGT